MNVVKDVCSNCGKADKECAEFNLAFFLKYRVCQSCVSRAFRSFKKNY